MPRDTFKYHFKIGNRIVHTGITSDIDRRENEHQQTFGESGYILKWGMLQRGIERLSGNANKLKEDDLLAAGDSTI